MRPGSTRWWAALAALAFLAVVLAVAGILSDRALPKAPTTVIVPSGTTAAGVADILARDGVVSSALAFRALARVTGAAPAVKAGEFRFREHLTLGEVLHEITTSGAQSAVWVTLPEGFTARQIAQAVAERGVSTESALETAFMSESLTFGADRTPTLEGYLFPSTYLIPLDATPADVAKILTDQFRRELPPDAQARAAALGFTIPQIVTLASLIEREAKADDERALMAGVYYNRLRRGMPLEVDATIEYIFPEHKTVITRADLAIDSPYNTYRNAGLPPTPIANPGKPSLDAAFHPQPSEYLYYVYKGDGHHAFSRTLAEHEANVARYLH